MSEVTIPELLKEKSADELAKLQAGYRPGSDHWILAEKEWDRRARKEQHELDLALILKQVRWMKYSVMASVIAALLGAAIGALLQSLLR
jgi:hypothetical protein